MKCSRCQAENREGRRFCGECGASLALTCSSCGFSNEPSEKFCGGCGQALTPAAAPASKFASPESYTPKHLAEKILTSKSALEGERKQVTVLFADLKGSMELLADRDPEEARKLLDPVLERMMEAVHRYEGTVNQVMGDGIMALFGAPLAHEDHAVRACYAALRMQEAVTRYGDEVQRSHGIPVTIRVGLNSGEVVVRSIGSDLHMDYTAVGQTTHLAGRMEQMAKPGSVLLTADTLRLAEGFVQVKPLGPVPVKGLEEPIEVYEVTGAGPVRRRLEAAVARGLTRFVGRDAELEHLRKALEQSGAGHGQLVAVVGEPGVGKSRLFYEFTRSHRTHGWLILESGSVSYGKATTYLPVIDLLKAYFQIEAHDDARKIREKVSGKLVTLDETLMPTLPAFLSLLDVPVEDPHWQDLDPPQRRQRTLDGVKRLLLRESQVQPLVVLFEDLHWIDGETQALLDSLVESLPTARVLLLVNYRPEYQHGWGGKTYYQQLRIDPLPAESVDELLQALLGDDPGLVTLKRLLMERSEGNPFFLEESVRTLVETKVLGGGRGAYRLARATQSLEIPATAQAVLAARIDRLSSEDKRLLQAASVIGKDVPFVLLQAIAEETEDAIRRGLAQLQAAEFLYETSLFPDLEYTFKHALTHDVAYQSLLKSSREQYHQRIAQALEERFPETVETQPEVLAHHFTEAGRNEQAVAYWQRAGRRALQRSANQEAIRKLTKGLELLSTLPDTPERTQRELDFQIALGPALIAIKGHGTPEVEYAYTRARELSQQVGETPQLFPALLGLSIYFVMRAELQTARELGEQLLGLAEHAQDPVLLVEAHYALGVTLFWLGELVPAREHLEQGIGQYNSHQHHSHIALYGQDAGPVCLCRVAVALCYLGHLDQALTRSHEALTLAQELSHPFSLTYSLVFASVLHHFRRESHIAQERAEAAVTLAREQGFALWLMWGTILHGWALTAQGSEDRGIAEMQQGLTDYRKMSCGVFLPYFLSLLAEGYGRAGQTEVGLATVAEGLGLVDEHRERWWESELYRLKGELLLLRTDPDKKQAETCFHQAIDVARRQQAKSLELRAALSLSRLWQRQGKQEEARQLLAETYGWFTEGFDTEDLKEAKALLEELS